MDIRAHAFEATRAAVSGRALGLHIDASYGFFGLQGARGPGDGRGVRLDLAAEAELDAAWPGSTRPAPPRDRVLVEHRPDTGYLVKALDCGRHLVDLDGRRIRTATAGAPTARWQGVLSGHALALAAILQGLEVFTASAVVVAGEVMALAGPPGVGKSALAARLMLAGARFFADDLVALEVRGSRVVAHAGVGVVRLGQRDRPILPQLTAHGADVAERDGQPLVELPRDVPALVLRSLYLVTPAPDSESVSIAPELPDPLKLLAGTHGHTIRTPERLRRQLDLVGLLSERVQVFTARLPRGGEDDLARAIFSHAALEVLV